ncbi:MAG: hypothetical protein AAGA78_00010 [Pseudomonadota bacterium]
MRDKKHTTISDVEEARIRRLIASDPNPPEVTDAQMVQREVLGER